MRKLLMSLPLRLLLLLLLTLLSLCLLSSSMPDSTYISFPLTYRDAESSLIRLQEADPSDLPKSMPMRDFIAAGRAMRERIEKQRQRRRAKDCGRGKAGPVVGRFSYLMEKEGDFYLTISVGNPPQRLIFLLDTGSELTWTQCKPCRVCGTSGVPTFSFSRSSSYIPVTCKSPLCKPGHGFFGGECDNSTGNCIFQVQYGDGSVDEGYVSVDAFHVSSKLSKHLVFGCAVISLDTVPTSSSGIMGLNRGAFSFISQLLGGNSNLPDKFAYCLPDRFKHLNTQGTILFGEHRLPIAKLRYTPLVPPYEPLGDLYYYVELEGISVGRSFIKATMPHRVKDLGVGGTIFDSGTALTELVSALYEELVMEMKRQTVHLHPFVMNETTSDLCYRMPLKAQELPKLPLVTMHFQGGVELELGPGSVLYPIGTDHKDIILCLAFSISEDMNIIGNYQQQNYWVEYNMQSSSIGLAKAQCGTKK